MAMQRLGLPYIRGAISYVIAAIVDALGSGLFLPLSLLYFTLVAHLPLASVGLTLSIATIVTLPVTPLTGILVDAIGARRAALCSQFLQAIGFVGYLFVANIPSLAAASLLVTGGARMFYAANTTLIAEIAVPNERDRWYGFVNALRNAGGGLGIVMAGVVIATGTGLGYRLLVIANAASFIITGFLLIRLRTATHATRPVGVTNGGYATVLRDIPYLGYVASNLILVLCSMVATVGVPVYVLEALAAPRWSVGMIAAVTTIFSVLGQPYVVRLTERYRRTRVLAVAGGVRGVGCFLYLLAPLIPHVALVMYLLFANMILTAGAMLHAPVASALAAEAGPVALRGRYLAVFELSWGLAAAIAPGLFTALYAVGIALPWGVLGIMAIATIVPSLLLERHLPSRAVQREYHVDAFRPAVVPPNWTTGQSANVL